MRFALDAPSSTRRPTCYQSLTGQWQRLEEHTWGNCSPVWRCLQRFVQTAWQCSQLGFGAKSSNFRIKYMLNSGQNKNSCTYGHCRELSESFSLTPAWRGRGSLARTTGCRRSTQGTCCAARSGFPVCYSATGSRDSPAPASQTCSSSDFTPWSWSSYLEGLKQQTRDKNK